MKKISLILLPVLTLLIVLTGMVFCINPDVAFAVDDGENLTALEQCRLYTDDIATNGVKTATVA